MHPFFKPLRAPLLMAPVLAIALFSPSGDAAPATPPQRWTAETPEKMIDRAKVRATAENAKEREILASIAVIADLSSVASHGARQARRKKRARKPQPLRASCRTTKELPPARASTMRSAS
jgi:hypothetical protein